MAILKLSEGNDDKLLYFAAIAKEDYRDVLMGVDNPPIAGAGSRGSRARQGNSSEVGRNKSDT